MWLHTWSKSNFAINKIVVTFKENDSGTNVRNFGLYLNYNITFLKKERKKKTKKLFTKG